VLAPNEWPLLLPVFSKLPAEVTASRYREAVVRVWQALEAQPCSGWVAFDSRPWLGVTRDGAERDGECDFVVAHAAHGVLAIEVKGGGGAYDPADNKWWSRDRDSGRAGEDLERTYRRILGDLHLIVNRMGAAGIHPNAHPKDRKILLCLRKF